MSFRMRAVNKRTGIVNVHVLRKLSYTNGSHRAIEEPQSVGEAKQAVQDWNEYNQFWEYSLISEMPTQTTFELFELEEL